MFVKNLHDCTEFTANDGCAIRELLHPEQDAPALPYSLAYARVAAGKASYRHQLKQTEIYFILRGTGMMHIGAESREVGTGDTVVIPAQAQQWIENTGPETLEFLAVVSPPWRAEDDTRLD